MSRLIDADALIEQLNEYIQENREENCCANIFAADVCEVLRDIYVNESPTVDATPVVHGRWIRIGGNRYTIVSQCSNCCAKYDFMSNYCPNCGADMR